MGSGSRRHSCNGVHTRGRHARRDSRTSPCSISATRARSAIRACQRVSTTFACARITSPAPSDPSTRSRVERGQPARGAWSAECAHAHCERIDRDPQLAAAVRRRHADQLHHRGGHEPRPCEYRCRSTPAARPRPCTFNGVPPGAYWVRIRARNAQGIGSPTPDIRLVVP